MHPRESATALEKSKQKHCFVILLCVCAHAYALSSSPMCVCPPTVRDSSQEINVRDVIVARLALLQRKCSALTMLSPGMHCRPPPRGACRRSGVGSQVWSVQFWPRGGIRPARLWKETEREGKEREGGERRSRFVCSL